MPVTTEAVQDVNIKDNAEVQDVEKSSNQGRETDESSNREHDVASQRENQVVNVLQDPVMPVTSLPTQGGEVQSSENVSTWLVNFWKVPPAEHMIKEEDLLDLQAKFDGLFGNEPVLEETCENIIQGVLENELEIAVELATKAQMLRVPLVNIALIVFNKYEILVKTINLTEVKLILK